MIAEIDAQISKLQQARNLLSGVEATPSGARRPGRPKGSKNAAAAPTKVAGRKLSPEGRKRIADAMKRRWAERKSSSTKGAAKAASSGK